MSFPVPVEYGLNDKKDNTVVKYNNGAEWEGLPSPLPGGGGGGDSELFHVKIEVETPTAGQPSVNILSRSHSVSEILQAIDDKKIIVITISLGEIGSYQIAQRTPIAYPSGGYIFPMNAIFDGPSGSFVIAVMAYRLDKENLTDYVETSSYAVKNEAS